MTDQKLIIVESPTKAKSIQKMLDASYTVLATKGHIFKQRLKYSDPNKINHYSLQFFSKKNQIVNHICESAQNSNEVFIATDPDREGESIAWHLTFLIQRFKKPVHRIILNEFSLSKLEYTLNHPGKINPDLVESQHARSVIDQMIGLKASSLLSSINPKARSAGRIQSAALILISQQKQMRKNKNHRMHPEILLKFTFGSQSAGKFQLVNLLLQDRAIETQDERLKTLNQLHSQAFCIKDIKAELIDTHDANFLNTSKMLQTGIRCFGKSGRQIMKIAQELYEGIELKDGRWINLITYPRTDSRSINSAAMKNLRLYLEQSGYEMTNSKISKRNPDPDGHEAIRPLIFSKEYDPETLKDQLSKSQLQLYQLIWNWSMRAALKYSYFKKQTILLNSGAYDLAVTNYQSNPENISEHGFSFFNTFNSETSDPAGLFINQKLTLSSFESRQNQAGTETLFDEASLINLMDTYSIGRPSSFAEILPILLKRNYVELKAKQIQITPLGINVVNILTSHLGSIFETEFSQKLEAQLDLIANHRRTYQSFISEFANELDASILKVCENLSEQYYNNSTICHLCGKKLIKRHNREGTVFVCSEHHST